MSKSSIYPIDRILSGASIPGQNGPGSNGNEEVLHIPQSSRTGVSLSDSLVSYLGHLLMGILPIFGDAVGVFYSLSQPDKQVIAYLGVMAINEYITLLNDPELEPRHRIQINVIPRTSLLLGVSSLRIGYSRHILSLADWAVS